MKLLGTLTAAGLAAVSLFALITLPPRPLRLPSEAPPHARTHVSGVFHVHTNRSDGTGTPEEIAATAAQAGLRFVIFTDHGNGMRQGPAARYLSGVLCIDAVEISTSDGHYIAVGMKPAPYPLAGNARGVIEDVARLGGFGVVAHPLSAKPQLRWLDWSAPFDGLEWLNADSEWRDEPGITIAHALLEYFFRPSETLASLLDRPVVTLARWEALSRRRRVVALAGVDAHQRISLRDSDPADGPTVLKIPTYRALFGTFTIHAELDAPLSGEATADASRLLDAIRKGHVYTAIDALAAPALFEFTAQSGEHSARAGDELPLGETVVFRTRANSPASATTTLFRDGAPVIRVAGSELVHEAPAMHGVYRVEVDLPHAPGRPPVPWIVSNPIYVGGIERGRPPVGPRPTRVTPLGAGEHQGLWRLERDERSHATLTKGPGTVNPGLEMAYRLAAGSPAGQYVALSLPLKSGLSGSDRLSFRIRADRPLRISVQIRAADSAEFDRWKQSVYVDQTERDVEVFFAEMAPVGRTATRRPRLDKIDTLLFVVDMTNSQPDSAARIWLTAVQAGH